MPDDKLKLELGGGTKPRDGFLNLDCRLDLSSRVDIFYDLENLGSPYLADQHAPVDGYRAHLPLEPDSVTEVFSAHCLEHVANLDGVLWELGRICCNGAKVEIHVPHYLHPDAMCPAHKHTIGENSLKGWTKREFCGKTFDLVSTKYMPSLEFAELKELHPGWKDSQILRFVPGACFQVEFVLRVRRLPKAETGH